MSDLPTNTAGKIPGSNNGRDWEGDIDWLARQFHFNPEWEQRIRRDCRRYPLSFRSQDHLFDRPHSYDVADVLLVPKPNSLNPNWANINQANDVFSKDAIEAWKVLNIQEVFAKLLLDGTFSAPAMNHTCVYDGKIEELIPPGQPVIKLVDYRAMTIWNVTLPPHIFFPGTIKLWLTEDAVGIHGHVHGTGKGNFAFFNEQGGRRLFTNILENFRNFLLGINQFPFTPKACPAPSIGRD